MRRSLTVPLVSGVLLAVVATLGPVGAGYADDTTPSPSATTSTDAATPSPSAGESPSATPSESGGPSSSASATPSPVERATTSPSASTTGPILTPSPSSSPTKTPTQQPTPTPNRWMPPMGPAFNDPVGTEAQKTRLSNRVLQGITHARRGSYVRLAMYSFDLPRLARAIIKAKKRGVHVQMLVNDNWTSSATVRLRKALGSNIAKKSFLRICHQSCRGGPGNLHLKVYAFSQTGGASDVIMTGSANLTDRAQRLQWNDLYTLSDEGLHDTFVEVFDQLKRDKKVKKGKWISYDDESVSAIFYRTKDGTIVWPGSRVPESRTTVSRKLPGPAKDPMLARLKNIKCTAPAGYGKDGHTVVRIMMYAWHGNRGNYLADQVADLARRGCNVAAILSVSGRQVRKKLAARGIPMRSADYQEIERDPNDDEPQQSNSGVNFYSHLKVLAINGSYEGAGARVVLTGSENWSAMAFRNDEVTIQVHGSGVFGDYASWFNYLWKYGTHAMGPIPDGFPPGGPHPTGL